MAANDTLILSSTTKTIHMKHILKILLPALILLQTSVARADEGMWIPLLLQSLNEKDMQQMGMTPWPALHSFQTWEAGQFLPV